MDNISFLQRNQFKGFWAHQLARPDLGFWGPQQSYLGRHQSFQSLLLPVIAALLHTPNKSLLSIFFLPPCPQSVPHSSMLNIGLSLNLRPCRPKVSPTSRVSVGPSQQHHKVTLHIQFCQKPQMATRSCSFYATRENLSLC